MEPDATEEKRCRKLWLIGDSYPAKWVDHLKEPLDPRHPTRHNIFTPVLDYLQDEVYAKEGLRLDIAKCYVFNAAAKQKHGTEPDWKWKGLSITSRIEQLGQLFDEYRPAVVITFGANAYRFAAHALHLDGAPRSTPNSPELGRLFRQAAASWSSSQPNLLPLLHAYVARSGWLTAGKDYSGNDADVNYFEFVGRTVGNLLIKNARKLPIWCDVNLPYPVTDGELKMAR